LNRVFVSILLCTLSWYGCKKESTEPSTSIPKFAFYKLVDSTITATKAWTYSVDSVNLSPSPFLTENDLTAYNWSTHAFTARPYIDTMFSHLRWLGGKSSGVPFVVVANGSRIYIGAFWWPYSSSIPMGAYIDTYLPSPYTIKRWNSASLPDLRGDDRIHSALKSAGILIE
jgi:hypothetical protein